MKKFLVALFAALTIAFQAKDGGNRANAMDVVRPGNLVLGVGVGTPHFAAFMIPVDFQWGLTSNFINAGKFGSNGAVDLGFQYVPAFNGGFYNSIVARSAFHFEFTRNLDTYWGLHMGCVFSYGGGAGFDFGMYWGVRYYFTDAFGIKFELSPAFVSPGATPLWNLGVAFRF